MKILSFFTLTLVTVLFQTCRSQTNYTFIIFNDIKGQLEEYRSDTANSTDKPVECPDEQGVPCKGGLRKVFQELDTLRNETISSNPFVLTPGNLVGGESGWLSILGWETYGNIVKQYYRPTAMSLGMNDFGAGLNRTLTYMIAASTPVVLSNVKNCDKATAGSDEDTFCRNITKTYNLVENMIGLLGFINPDVTKLSSPGKLEFSDVIPALRDAISQDNGKHEMYIAMGDGSLDLAKQILTEIPKIKLVIYGRAFGSSKDMSGNFPEKYGNVGYIATAGNYGSSIGELRITLTNDGNIVSSTGSQLHVTDKTSYDSGVDKFYTDLMQQFIVPEKKPIGSSHYMLEGGDICWRQECNLGNLVTDSMVHCALSSNLKLNIPSNEPIFSIWHSGALFKDTINPDSNISSLDIHKWLPYHNRVCFVTILGSQLLEVFKISGQGISAKDNPNVKDWGQLLQVSNGVEVSYSTSGEDPKIRLLHSDGVRPEMQPVNPTKMYYFVIPSFIMEGRNVYGGVQNFWKAVSTNPSFDFDDNCVRGYVEAMKRVATGFEERIWIDNGPTSCGNTYTTGTNTAVTVVVTIVVTLIIIGVLYAAYFYVLPTITGRRPDGFNNF